MKLLGGRYETHPAADLFPLMDVTSLGKLSNDIRDHGLHEPVVMLGAKVLDGRNRLLACDSAGVNLRPSDFMEWDGKGSPVEWVLSKNLHRRHLTDSQRAMVGAASLPMLAAEAKTRQGAGLKKGTSPVSANLHQREEDAGRAAAHAAAVVNVSPRSIAHAAKVLEEGVPELQDAVRSDRVAVSTAAEIASEPVARQREIAKLPEREILQAAKEIRQRKTEERRTERLADLVEIARGNTDLSTASPSGQRYPVIYADPPWRYEHCESETRAIENQYPTMALEDICALPVADVLATPDAILFLWATSPKLAESMQVITAWGFVYRTCAVWDKAKIGMGYYFRQQHELLLVATRGTPPAPPPSARPSSVFRVERGEHSAKPDELRRAIEAMYPTLPRVEMFCRSAPKGWAVWGNQAGRGAA